MLTIEMVKVSFFEIKADLYFVGCQDFIFGIFCTDLWFHKSCFDGI